MGVWRKIWVLAAATALAGCGANTTASKPKVALIYGDSLAFESLPTIERAFTSHRPWVPVLRTFPAAAPCQWLTTLRTDLATYKPASVTISTTGSNFPDCMHGLHLGSVDYYARYRADLASMFTLISRAGATVVFLEDPPMFGLAGTVIDRVDAIAADLATHNSHVRIDHGAFIALSDHGRYVTYLPCLKSEKALGACPSSGRIEVRTLRDGKPGIHFCPPGLLAVAACPVYSSGEVRFGRALVAAATLG